MVQILRWLRVLRRASSCSCTATASWRRCVARTRGGTVGAQGVLRGRTSCAPTLPTGGGLRSSQPEVGTDARSAALYGMSAETPAVPARTGHSCCCGVRELQHSKSHRVPFLQSAQADVTLGICATEGAHSLCSHTCGPPALFTALMTIIMLHIFECAQATRRDICCTCFDTAELRRQRRHHEQQLF